MVYKFKSAAQLSHLDAQACGKRLEQIEKKSGAITPVAVVNDARSKASPLHDAFTWDDKEAAEAHRLNEARYLLRNIVVVTSEPEDKEPTVIRAFISVPNAASDDVDVEEPTKGSSYINVTDALSDPKLRAVVLKRAYGELLAWKCRYEALEEFAGVRKAIASVKFKAKAAA